MEFPLAGQEDNFQGCPDMDRDMQALARQTIRKLEAMTNADFEDVRFLFTDE